MQCFHINFKTTTEKKFQSTYTHKKICLLYFTPSIQNFLIVCQTQNFLDLFMLNLSTKSTVDPKKKCEKAHNDIKS